ncbi:MAG TPA: hypothetical protein VF646_16870, partial [Cytophagales bacterium]
MRHFFATGLLPGLLGLVLLTAWAGAMPVAPAAGAPQTNPSDTARVHQLLELGHRYIMKPGQHADDLDTALQLTRQAQDLSRSLGYQRGQGLGLLRSAQAYREQGDPQRGR